MESDLSDQLRRRYSKEGRGQGEGAAYVPGLNQWELSRGVGRMRRFACSRCGGRQVILPSDAMLSTFLLEHWDPATCDLKEYFPLLDVDQTVWIARRLDVRHPRLKDGSPAILHCGLIVCRRRGEQYRWEAVDTISAYDADSVCNTVSPTHQIIREFWRLAGIEWSLVRSTGLNDACARNLWLLFGYGEQVNAWGLDAAEICAQDAVRHRLQQRVDGTVVDACHAAAAQTGLSRGSCIRAAMQLFATRRVGCRIDAPRLVAQPVAALTFGHACRPARIRRR